MPPGGVATCAITEILRKGGIVLLHSSCGTGITISQRAIDHIEAGLTLIQPQLKVGAPAAREVLRAPFDVKDPVGSSPTYRCEYAKPTVHQIQVVPVREDGVVVGSPRQASVRKGRICGRELGVAVGRQIDRGEGLVVQCVSERQSDSDYRIIPVIADVHGARHDAAAYLSDRVLRCAAR